VTIHARTLCVFVNVQALHSDTFIYVNNLRELNVAGNVIEFLYDRAFDGLSNLLSLSLANNHINYLPENVFLPLVNLSDLMLHDNRLEFVWPRTFVGLTSLKRLTLAANRLTSLPEAALRHSPALRYLDLSDNNFRSLERCAFPVSTSALRTLSVIGNPVVCNCSLAWLASERPDDVSGGRQTRRVVWGTCRHIGQWCLSQTDSDRAERSELRPGSAGIFVPLRGGSGVAGMIVHRHIEPQCDDVDLASSRIHAYTLYHTTGSRTFVVPLRVGD